jgi:hypothetical protein
MCNRVFAVRKSLSQLETKILIRLKTISDPKFLLGSRDIPRI